MRRRRGLAAGLVLLGLLAARAADAQTQGAPVTLPPNAPYTVQWQHDGTNGPQFRLYVDGVVAVNWPDSAVTKSQTADAAGLYTYSAPGAPLSLGPHVLILAAYNNLSEGRAAPISESSAWDGPPSAPSNVMIIKVTVQVVKGGG